MVDSPIIEPTLFAYAILCLLFNAFINWLNRRWRDSRQLWGDQVPPDVAMWMKANPGIRCFHGSCGHPFTPLLVIAGIMLTVIAAAIPMWGQMITGQQAITTWLVFLSVGGVIMTAGDAYRYLVYG